MLSMTPPGRHLFRPGSVSKLITATAVMQLVQSGDVGLDADVQDCEPEDPIDAIRRLAGGYGLVDQAVTRRVMTKIGVRDRLQTVVWAYQNGLAEHRPPQR
jgi:CubicO group peptidase (beta-lactamase class C family)